jgi:hypothetical protein
MNYTPTYEKALETEGILASLLFKGSQNRTN